MSKYYCKVCNKQWTRNENYQDHFIRPTHIKNQASYDGNLETHFEKEKEEWDKERASLLKINRGDIENSISLRDINAELRRQIEMYQENERKKEMKEDNQKKDEKMYVEHLECIANKYTVLEKEKEQWLVEKKAFQKEIRIMKQQFELALATMKQANDDLQEQLKTPTITIEPTITERLEALENTIIDV